MRTRENRQKILSKLAETGRSLTFVGNLLGFSHDALWKWKKEDPEFAAEVDAAIQGPGTDKLEDVAMDHAVNGWPEPLTYQGEITYQYKGWKTEKYKKADGTEGRKRVPNWILDAKGNRIPETITRYDHAFMGRMLDRRRPVASKVELDTGPSLEQMLAEMNKKAKAAVATAKKAKRRPYI
jgi:hypothetical protein